MVFVEPLDEVQPATLVLGFDKSWRCQIDNRITLAAKWSALKNARKKASPPILSPSERVAYVIEQHDKSRQILVLTSQTVGRPGTGARSSRLDETRHHLKDGWSVVIAERMHRSHHCDVVNTFGDVREELRDLDAR